MFELIAEAQARNWKLRILAGRAGASHPQVRLSRVGSRAKVSKAFDTTLDREVAIRFIPEEIAGEPERLTRRPPAIEDAIDVARRRTCASSHRGTGLPLQGADLDVPLRHHQADPEPLDP